MKKLLVYIFVIFSAPVFGQVAQCSCSNDTLMNNGATVKCDTIVFKNNSKIYWQYNCDSIWLTLENSQNKRFIIDKVPVEYYDYAYRLGYYFIKEFDKTILFSSGCPANGSCIYRLVDKTDGKVVKTFNHLICIDSVDDNGNYCKYKFDFVVYLSENINEIVVYFIDSGRMVKKRFVEKVNAIEPEKQFDSISYLENMLTIAFFDNKNNLKKIVIDLK